MMLKLNIIKTNIREILIAKRIEHDFNEQLLEGTLWLRLLIWVILPLTSPLSIGRFDRLMIAAPEDPSND